MNASPLLRKLLPLAAVAAILLSGCADSSGSGSGTAGASGGSGAGSSASVSLPDSGSASQGDPASFSSGADASSVPGGSGASSASSASSSSSSNSDAQVPVLTFTLEDLDGNSVNSAELFSKSELTMLNVWGTYCGPCLQEMPELGALSASLDPSKVQIVGVLCDVWDDSEEDLKQTARDLVEQTGASYLHLFSGFDLYGTPIYNISAVPTTFFVNSDGNVLCYAVGSRSGEDWEGIIHDVQEQYL